MNQIKKLIFVLFLTIVTTANAQKTEKQTSTLTQKNPRIETNRFLKDWALSIGGGATNPFTDIRSYDYARKFNPKSEIQWNAQIGLTKMFSGVFGVYADYNIGKLQGITVSRGGFAEDRNKWKQLGFDQPVYFKVDLYHQLVAGVYVNWSNMFFNLNKQIRSNIKNKPMKAKRFAFYNKMGLGYIRFESNIYNLADDKPVNGNAYLRGYTNKATELLLPIAMGTKVKLSKSFDLGIETAINFVFSDKLDALNYNQQNRNALHNDKYVTANVMLTYKFGRINSQKEHIEWVNPLEAYMSSMEDKFKDLYKVKDADKDGVIDELDDEPESLEGAIVNTHGVTLDSDKDGIPDSKDKEPYSTPLLPIEDGVNKRDAFTPEQLKGITNIVNNITNSGGGDSWDLSIIFFDLDKYNIKPSEVVELYKIASVMKKHPELKVNVQGHTDTRNTKEYNEKLSENRVNSAIDFLVTKFGIDKNRFVPNHFGKQQNLIPNATAEDMHRINRRVEFSPYVDDNAKPNNVKESSSILENSSYKKFGSVYFEENNYTLTTEAKGSLDAFIEKLKSTSSNISVYVSGDNADETLSAKRYIAVKNYLDSKTLNKNISIIPFGKDLKINADNNEDDAKSRRIDIYLAGE